MAQDKDAIMEIKDEDNDGKADVAKRGEKDSGKMVSGALGEPLIGSVADVTDEDR